MDNTHPDDEALVRGIANLEARIPRLTRARDDARAEHDRAALDAATLVGQEERRHARTANGALRIKLIDKSEELEAETAALATARQRLADQRARRVADAEAAQAAEEHRTTGEAVRTLYNAMAAVDDACTALAKLWPAVPAAAALVYGRIPARDKEDVAHELATGKLYARLRQRLADLGCLPGFGHSQMDATAPDARLVDAFRGSMVLESLLPSANDKETLQ